MWTDFIKGLKRFFSKSDDVQTDLSARWREHANRRTTIIVVIVATLFSYVYVFHIRPPGQFPAGKLVSVPEGSSVRKAAQLLREQGVVRSPLFFRLSVFLFGFQDSVRAGDYLFKEPFDVFTVARKVSYGVYGLEPARFRIHEGATVREMASIYDGDLQRFNKEEFIAKALPLEGYLFPDTYFFLPNATADTVIDAMRHNFDDHLTQPLEGSTTLAALMDASGISREDIVKIASILEREARNSADRRMIAGVIFNRLKKNMPLQIDATFLYTLGKGTFDLTMADLISDSPYNTYKNKGLPPTPIGSPSLDSLMAAVTPTKSNYIYFLADHSGVTHYCKDYDCQLANKEKYF